MPANPSKKKADRLREIELLLLSHPEGFTQADLARRLGIHRSTVHRYMPSLPGYIYIDTFDGERWKIDRRADLINVHLSLDEAMAVHLATRLLATRLERQNPHAASALRKLGTALERLAPRISRHLLQSADSMDDPGQRQDPNFLRTLETLTLAWAQLRKVRLWHRKDDGRVQEFVFAPYFIEPYAVGQSVHTIGWREPPAALRTLRLDRIDRIELLGEPYELPPDFNPDELLKDAWGIWYTDSEPVEVRLRFTRAVAHRVRETRWHRSEQVEALPNGELLWRAWIAAPREMFPWSRGWGANVEVLAPADVRAELAEEARQLFQLYEGDESASQEGDQ